ncbi:MAG TPA: hypothetical protein VHD62_04985 [Opitutaceae bacterium]|nr:hypothetical protein [Opitutaceae bacterium]
MKRIAFFVALALSAAVARAAERLPIEQQVAEAVKSPQLTVVHLWAPWCPNCKAELANGGWSTFIAQNPGVNFIFVTVRRGDEGDGRAMLEKNGVGPQKNFSLLVHPNGVRSGEGMITEFMGLPLTWIPTTWIFRDGKLRYALNFGEVRFPMLQQLLRDSTDKWEH